MIGEKYDNWLVIKYIGKDKHSHHKLLCQCQCDKKTIREIDKNDLLKGNTKSCGRCNIKEIKVGDRFGKWTVLGVKSLTKALCKCDCEFQTIREVEINSLRQGTSLSCGCRCTKFEAGKIVGQWKVLRRLYSVNNQMLWECECQCSDKTIKALTTSQLTSGYPQSCGCFRKNKFKIKDNYVIGIVGDEQQFIFDKEDFNKVKKYSWFIDGNGYVVANDAKAEKQMRLHRYLMNPTELDIVDHINRNPSDNRKSNLRICDYKVNNRNRSLGRNNTSGFAGVTFDKSRKKWMAHLKVDNKFINLGRYDTIEEAIIKRRKGEIELHDNVKYYEYEDALDIKLRGNQ